jgi:hypothetical protein
MVPATPSPRALFKLLGAQFYLKAKIGVKFGPPSSPPALTSKLLPKLELSIEPRRRDPKLVRNAYRRIEAGTAAEEETSVSYP